MAIQRSKSVVEKRAVMVAQQLNRASPGYKMEKKDSIPLVTEEARLVLEQFLSRSLSLSDGVPLHRQRSATTTGMASLSPMEIIYESVSAHPLHVGRSTSYRQASQESILDELEGGGHSGGGLGSTTITKSMTISACDYNYNKRAMRRSRPESSTPDGTLSRSSRYSTEEELDSPVSDHESLEEDGDSESGPRRKKSFFKRATERLRQSFRIMNKDMETNKPNASPKNADKKSKHKKMKRSKSKEEKLAKEAKEKEKEKEKQREKEKSHKSSSKGSFLFRRPSKGSYKSPVNTPDKTLTPTAPNIGIDSATPVATPTSRSSSLRSASLKIYEESTSAEERKRKSPQRKASWRDGDGSGVLDNLMHNIRKGLRRKKSKAGTDSDGSFRNRSKTSTSRPEERVATHLSPPRRHTATASTHLSTGTSDVYKRMLSLEDSREIDRVPVIPSFASSNIVPVPEGEALPSCRDSLTLPGLVPHRPRSPSNRLASFDETDFSYYSHYYHKTEEVTVKTPESELEHSHDSEISVSGIPLHERTDKEKDEIFERVARRLAAIADNYVAAHTPIDAEVRVSLEEQGAAAPARGDMRLNTLERDIVDVLREQGDGMTQTMTFPTATMTGLATAVTSGVATSLTYNSFQQAMTEAVGNEPGWQQVGLLFQLTKAAVNVAGASGSMAVKIKELSLKYFEDKFAGWIVVQGGWESLTEGEYTDSELD